MIMNATKNAEYDSHLVRMLLIFIMNLKCLRLDLSANFGRLTLFQVDCARNVGRETKAIDG